MVKNVFLTFFTSLQRKGSFRCAPSIKNLTARWMPVHPCTGHKLTKNGGFHHPATEPLKIEDSKCHSGLRLGYFCLLSLPAWLRFSVRKGGVIICLSRWLWPLSWRPPRSSLWRLKEPLNKLGHTCRAPEIAELYVTKLAHSPRYGRRFVP